MNINLSISPAPGITTDNLVVAIYEATAPTTLIDTIVLSAPHTSVENISFIGVNPVPHYVTIYQTPGTSDSGTIRHHFLYDPSFKDAKIRDDLFLIADTTTGFSSTSIDYTDATLEGWSFDIERRGFGTMQPTVDYLYDSSAFKWTLIPTADNPTPNIEPGEVFVLHFQPQITTTSLSTGPVPVAPLFTGNYLISGDITLDSTYLGKVGLIAGAGDSLVVSLPSLSSVADNKTLTFISSGGSHILSSLKCAGSDAINYLKDLRTEVYLAQSEWAIFFKAFNQWNLITEGNHKEVGQLVHSHLTAPINTIFANGQILSRVTYARLWEYVQSLDVSELVNDSDWTNTALNNQGRYSTGDGSTTFRVPILYTPGFLKAVDGTTRKAGSWEDNSLQSFDATIGIAPNGFSGGTLMYARGGSSIGDATVHYAGSETKPKNTGIYLSIKF
jgi:hypothetical protein